MEKEYTDLIDLPLGKVMLREDWKDIIEYLKLKTVEEDGLISVRYDLHDSPRWEYLAARQARGAIFNKDMVQVCRGFDKFFNYGEEHAAEIDWTKDVKVLPKLDGSLVKVWVNDGQVKYSGNKSINLDRTNDSHGVNMLHLFKEAIGDVDSFETYVKKFPGHTFLFELTSPQAKIVLEYEDTKATFLALVNNSGDVTTYDTELVTEDDELPESFEILGIAMNSDSSDDVFKRTVYESGIEGYVVTDGENYLKFKTEEYVNLHHMLAGTPRNPRKIVDLFMTGEYSEIVRYFPYYKEVFDLVAFAQTTTLHKISDMVNLVYGEDVADDKIYDRMSEAFTTVIDKACIPLAIREYRGYSNSEDMVNKAIVKVYKEMLKNE